MTVSKYASQAGKRYEKLLLDHLREQGYDAERLRLAGAEDEGDLLLRFDHGRTVIEAKRRKGFDLAGWVKEAQVERDNYAAHRELCAPSIGFVVVHYARGKNISQSYVTTTLEEWLRGL
jgi:Holliday junction resolvase